MNTGIGGLCITSTLSEMQVLGSQHSLCSHKVWIHSFPTPGQCTAVEDHLNAKVVGIRKDIFVELHHCLLVATEKVDLDS